MKVDLTMRQLEIMAGFIADELEALDSMDDVPEQVIADLEDLQEVIETAKES